MTLSMPAKLVAAAALAAAAFCTASAAHAASNVYISVGVQGAPVYMEPTPVYAQPQPVYVQPRRVYVEPPVYAAPGEVYVRPCPPGYASSYEAERAWQRAEWHRRLWRHHHHDWDRYESRGRNWD